MPETASQSDKYAIAKRERQKYVDVILQSEARRKVVVAGPGTGKTHLFKLALKGKPKSLTLSFINSLVQDLSLESVRKDHCGLHSFRSMRRMEASLRNASAL